MLPITFPEVNFEFGKPKGWTDEQCFSLPVYRGSAPIDDKGTESPVIISCWKLSVEDWEQIMKDGVIWLSISGTGMPPVSLYTENPFKSEVE